MVEYDTGVSVYTGKDINDIVLQVRNENIEKNRKFPGRNPYPVDYNAIYNTVHKGLENLKKIAHHSKGADRNLQANILRRHVTFRDAVNAAKSIVSLTAGNIVTTEEMTRRANICAKCPFVNKNAGCSLCKFGAYITSTINAIRRIANHSFTYPIVKGLAARDSNCGYCGCSHVMILPAKISCFNETDEKNEGRPDICWIKRDGVNYIPEA